MEAPIINNRIEKETIFSPEDYLKYKKDIENKIIPKLSKKCIICFEKSFINFLFDKIEKINWIRDEIQLYSFKEKDMLIAYVNYGGALSTIAVEELIALEVNEFVVLGSAGSIQKYIDPGSYVIVDKAIREEGVSYHYMEPSKYVECSEKLLEKSKKIIQDIDEKIYVGTSWTTDGLYRETIEKVKKYQEEGVFTVDMEASSLYSVAKFRNVDFLSIFYISDSIKELKWNPKFESTNSFKTQSFLIGLALKILL